MARKTKYDDNTFPLLAQGYAREGMNDKQISAKLGISLSSYYEYQIKYSEFMDSIKRGKSPVDVEVENTLLKRALGYEYVETQSIVKLDSEKGTTKPVEMRKVTKLIQPDITACIFWLKNRKPKVWRDVQKIEHGGDFEWGDIIRSFSSDRAKLEIEKQAKDDLTRGS